MGAWRYTTENCIRIYRWYAHVGPAEAVKATAGACAKAGVLVLPLVAGGPSAPSAPHARREAYGPPAPNLVRPDAVSWNTGYSGVTGGAFDIGQAAAAAASYAPDEYDDYGSVGMGGSFGGGSIGVVGIEPTLSGSKPDALPLGYTPQTPQAGATANVGTAQAPLERVLPTLADNGDSPVDTGNQPISVYEPPSALVLLTGLVIVGIITRRRAHG